MKLKTLDGHELPAFYDVAHVLGTFDIDINVSKFVDESVNVYRIKKRNNEYREIYVPNFKLKSIQKWIQEKILQYIEISESAHAFVKGKSILTNAKEHIRKDRFWILRMDVSNFFESIEISDVKKIFEHMGYSVEVASVLASLCCQNGILRQGFSTSPTLTNIYMNEFDAILKEFLNGFPEYKFVYTRYADDIIVSGRYMRGHYYMIQDLKKHIRTNLNSLGLDINTKKTLIQKQSRKKITGLYIENGKIFVSNNYIKKFKQEIYYCQKYGVIGHLSYENKILASNFKGYMLGKCAFLKMIDTDLGNELYQQVERLDW